MFQHAQRCEIGTLVCKDHVQCVVLIIYGINQTIDLQGRRCDQVEDFFFTGPLDYLLFEGELALGSTKPPTVVIKRKPAVSLASGLGGNVTSAPLLPPASDTDTTWTGLGFMQVIRA